MSYLCNLYSGIKSGDIVISTFKPNKIEKFPIGEIAKAEKRMLELAPKQNVYFGVAPMKSGMTGRGKNADALAMPMFMIDCDIKSTEVNVHSKNGLLFESLEEFLEMARELGAPGASYIRNSGNGYYIDYIFEDPLVLTNDIERKAASEAAKRFQQVFIAAAKEHGRHLDSVGDLARVTRMPGTYNHKTNPPKPVTIEHEWQGKIRFEELMEWVASAERHLSLRSSHSTSPRRRTSDTKQYTDDEVNFDPIHEGCAWVRQVSQNTNIPEPDWFHLASILERCRDGKNKFHEISALDNRYDPEETDSKLGRHEGPVRCNTVRDLLGFKGCSSCTFGQQEAMTSPILLGRRERHYAHLASCYAYNVQSGQFVHTQTSETLNEKAFNAKFRHLSSQPLPTNLLLGDKLTAKARCATYAPGEARFLHVGGELILNNWKNTGVEPKSGDCSDILTHIEHVFPQQEAREHFLKTLAFHAQKPSEKVRHALLIIGKQGLGKSFFMSLFKKLWGEENCLAVEGTALEAKYKAQLTDRRVLALEELRLFGRQEAYEASKMLIADDKLRVEEKHIPTYEAVTPRLIFAFSNNVHPISLAADDRRFWVYHSPATPKEPGHYERLFSEQGGMGQASAFLDYLLRFDVADYDPSARPPITSAKEYVIEQSKPELVRELETMISEGAPPLKRDLYLMDDLVNALCTRLPYHKVRNVGRVVAEFGHVSIKQVRYKGRKPRPWAWRNQHFWIEATAEQIRAELDRS
ncbi:hypothetical protein JYP49_08405 [Nitratireductor aquimarinus]|uniref:DUF5906 domain-containing protein n=1 Tax=Nitratireductor TaxID=245876 RepID=UPI0019D3B3F8|nr:primase-helicase family protein [Nitratireductor aquimarinus]MBN7775940.1 hypothetical protein [Nitratireductor pacificus]MBN7780603.1 hypothetical protein [Nitratireductor pacificus]MBN7789410.1 hypothetical protein [Nitratireductor aquimarinus]MBY6098688.1 hypothetical protein [Nitratireductor aquimarinus]MCA1259574.1 DUF5906 domain-containing protein [Nitratireductor aquimarinus]